MTKAKNPRYVTPTGTFQYPYLTKPDTKFNPDGEYKLKLEIPSGKAVEEIATFLDEQFDAAIAKAKKENPGKRLKEGERPYFINEDNGSLVVNFKLKAKVTPKVGDPFEQKPAIFDSKGKPLVNVNIGGGTKGKIAYEVVPYYTAIAGAGVSLRLKAVQVIDLVEYSSGGGDGSAFGFGKEDGYEAEESAAEKNGFTEETDEDTEDF